MHLAVGGVDAGDLNRRVSDLVANGDGEIHDPIQVGRNPDREFVRPAVQRPQRIRIFDGHPVAWATLVPLSYVNFRTGIVSHGRRFIYVGAKPQQ